MKRYGSGYNVLLELDFDEFIEQVECAINKTTEDLLMKRWITNYEQHISFGDFKQKIGFIDTRNNDAKKEHKSIEVIKEDVGNILRLFS